VIGWVGDDVVYWLASSLVFFLWCFVDLLLGMGVVFLIGIQFLAHRICLESSVQIAYVVPRLLTRLSPGNDMIPDDRIMACPMG
jgi:hypothetical protein